MITAFAFQVFYSLLDDAFEFSVPLGLAFPYLSALVKQIINICVFETVELLLLARGIPDV